MKMGDREVQAVLWVAGALLGAGAAFLASRKAAGKKVVCSAEDQVLARIDKLVAQLEGDSRRVLQRG